MKKIKEKKKQKLQDIDEGKGLKTKDTSRLLPENFFCFGIELGDFELKKYVNEKIFRVIV